MQKNKLTQIVWIFYFGTTSAAAPHAWVDSYAITRPQRPYESSMPQMSTHHNTYNSNGTLPIGSPPPPALATSYTSQPIQTQYNTTREDSQRVDSVIEEPTSYPHRAKAIYAYEADAKDPNEISFTKGEMLEVSADITSKWWTVRKADGTRGIAPSNYLSLEN